MGKQSGYGKEGWLVHENADAESETKVECDEITERIVPTLGKNAVNNAISMPILKGMDQLKLMYLDMYTCHLIKLYYNFYRNKLPAYFETFIPEYGESQHDLRHNTIHLPAIRCEYEKMNAKYQMHYR